MSEFSPEQHYQSNNLEFETEYLPCIPDEFRENPLQYFETHGIQIKDGDPKIDDEGKLRDDPTAVKVFPEWTSIDGQAITVVGKRVNPEKGELQKSGDPLHEYRIIQRLYHRGLPVARPVAAYSGEKGTVFVTEKIIGLGWNATAKDQLTRSGFTDEEVQSILEQASEQLRQLQQQFEAVGVQRKWELKDMVLDIDMEHKNLRKIVPTDWERTRLDEELFASSSDVESSGK
jgi:hypothetical protein